MKAVIAVFLLVVTSPIASAQKPPVKFGEITMEEMLMRFYEKDSSASVVILADYGTASIQYRQDAFMLDFERTTRIKILARQGVDYANFTIPLHKNEAGDETLDFIKGMTYNLKDGKIVKTKLQNDGIFTHKHSPALDLVKVTCPNVVEGSVVEITYKINSGLLSKLRDWTFQSDVPTIYSEYRTTIPEYFQYDKYLQGNSPIEVSPEVISPKSVWITSTEREGENILRSVVHTDKIDFMEVKSRWVAHDLPAFKPEPFMPPVNHFSPKVTIELAAYRPPDQPASTYKRSSWEGLNSSFIQSKNFGGEIRNNDFLQHIVDELTTDQVLPEEKIAVVCNYIKENVIWDGKRTKYPVSPLAKVIANKSGNSAEINLLLASMLEKANIAVSPVLLSTVDHGPVYQDQPTASQFNYVICLAEVNGGSYLLDATDRLLPLGLLPRDCLNGAGFLVSDHGFKWISLDSKFKSHTITAATLSLTPPGKLEGELQFTFGGYAASDKRKEYLLHGEEKYLKDLVKPHSWELKSSKILNVEEVQNNLTEVHEVVIHNNVMSVGDLVYLDPFVCNAWKSNPFREEERKYPVDFGGRKKETFFLTLTVPDNFTIEGLPENITIVMPGNGGKFSFNVSQVKNVITVTSMLDINKSVFTQYEYPYLREFYNQIVAKQAQQIVLKRSGL